MSTKVKKNSKCIACGHKDLIKYLDLGECALANSYIDKKDFGKKEWSFPLRVFVCSECYLAQLTDWVDRKKIFEHYAYFTSKSKPLHEHFRKYAEDVYKKFPAQTKKLTLEIGSNDGFLLGIFKEYGGAVLGIDPAKNIAEAANDLGLNTWPVFFNSSVAEEVLKKYGEAGIITANNVLAHTDNLLDIVSGVKKLLSTDGVFVFEVQYLGDLIKNNEFDNTYHEHIYYFSLAPLIKLLNKFDLKIFDIKKVNTQGGSIRVFSSHKDAKHKINKSVSNFLVQEKKLGLQNIKTYQKFSKVPEKVKKELVQLLTKLKKQNKTIIGYGAAAKGNTLLQYCKIGPELIDYLVDTTPAKQGKYTPGTHIPIFSRDQIEKKKPDYILILAWNYADVIMKNEVALHKKGVKFIVPVPSIKVL